MREFLLLLNIRAVVLVKGITDLRWHALGKNISSLVIFGGVAIGTFLILRLFIAYLVHQVQVDLFSVHRLLALVLLSFFLALNMVSFLVSYATLYASEDVPFLLGLPVAHTTVFGVRMVENIVTSATTLSLLGMAGVLAYGSVFHLSFWSYLFIMFGAFVPFVVIAGMLAVMTLTVLILIAARIGVRWMVAIAIPVYLGGTSLLMGSLDPMTVIRTAAGPYGMSGGSAVPQETWGVYWLPSDWLAQFLNALVRQETAQAWGYAGLLFLLLALLTLLAVLVGRKWFYTAWLAAADMRMRRTPAGRWFRLSVMEFGRFWGYRPHLEAVLKRDFWMFFRDPMQRVHLMMMLFVVCGVVFTIRSLDVVISQPASQVLSFVTVFVFVGFVVSSMILRFVFPTVSLEGDTFWAVRTAPITLSRLYWMKFAIALVLALVPAELMILFTLPSLRGPSSLLMLAMVGMAGVVVALVSLNIGSGAYYATLKENNPVKVASSQGASVTFLASLAILLVVAGILSLPAAVLAGVLTRRIPSWDMAIALGGITLIAGTVTVTSHQMGLRALRKDF